MSRTIAPRLSRLAFVAALLAAAGAAAPAQAQMTPQQLVACMLDGNSAVREPCIRAGLQSQDPNIRAAGLAAVFRTRSVIVIEYEIPERVQVFQARMDRGELPQGARLPDDIIANMNFNRATNQSISLRVDRFDNQTNAIQFTTRDQGFIEANTADAQQRNRRGQGTISGETLQLSFSYGNHIATVCSATMSIVGSSELRGPISCTSTGTLSNSIALMRTAARIRFF